MKEHFGLPHGCSKLYGCALGQVEKLSVEQLAGNTLLEKDLKKRSFQLPEKDTVHLDYKEPSVQHILRMDVVWLVALYGLNF